MSYVYTTFTTLQQYVTTGEMPCNKIFAHPLPLNVIPHIDKFQDNMYTKEEMKVSYYCYYRLLIAIAHSVYMVHLHCMVQVAEHSYTVISRWLHVLVCSSDCF
jgi:hypothetical protein